MKISRAVDFCLQYHKINSRPNTLANYEIILRRFKTSYGDQDVLSITTEDIIAFLAEVSEGRKQNTKRCRYSTLSAFFNLVANSLLPEFNNPCQSLAAKNLFKKPKATQWIIFDKDMVDEAILRTIDSRNRIMLELMARGGMRVSEVLNLKPADIDDQKLFLHDPKSGRDLEVVFIPKKICRQLQDYVREN